MNIEKIEKCIVNIEKINAVSIESANITYVEIVRIAYNNHITIVMMRFTIIIITIIISMIVTAVMTTTATTTTTQKNSGNKPTWGFHSNKVINESDTTESTICLTSGLPNRVFVWPSNSGSGTFTFTTAVRPSRKNSPGMFATPSFNLPS